MVKLTNSREQSDTSCQIHGPMVDIVCDHFPPLHQALFVSLSFMILNKEPSAMKRLPVSGTRKIQD